ncbi:MAG: hypothetical protein J6S91_08670, partial [Treponema sp.]|nr:hypothetical protein [Treponema sp.]
ITYIKQGKILASQDRESFKKSYILVAGKKEQLNDELNSKIIGLHTHQLGFEGMMKVEDSDIAKNAGLECNEPSLDDIMVHIERH